MTFKTEEEVLDSLAQAADLIVKGLLTGEQAAGISKLADIALLAIRQQSPAKYGYFIWNQHPLFGPYGSTLQGPLKF